MSGSFLTLRRRRSGSAGSLVRLNLTSMIDMFTIMVVFLLKNFSTQGQLVTPAQGLLLPSSTVRTDAAQALNVKVSLHSIMVENQVVVDAAQMAAAGTQESFLIQPLYDVLHSHAVEGRRSSQKFNMDFSGAIAIQGDVAIPYNLLTRVMYTCGQAGFPVMNLIVYRREG